MKFLHLSDLHLGKTIYGVSLIESGDQAHFARKLIETARYLKPDAVVIAGDVYDRANPTEDAVELFGGIITAFAEMNLPVFISAGNHDSGKRLSFAREILAARNVHVAGNLNREPAKYSLSDEYGEVRFWLLPYTFPAAIARALDDEEIKFKDLNGALAMYLQRQDIDFSVRNVLVAHQNVTAGGDPVKGGSESMVGNSGSVSYRLFDGFDYAALGHIHAAYPVGRNEVRYCGTPLCYHFDETKYPDKGALLVELKEKGAPVSAGKIVIEPLHRMVELKGDYSEVIKLARESLKGGEYVKAVITDRRVTSDVHANINAAVSGREGRLLEITGRVGERAAAAPGAEQKNIPIEDMFAEFYYNRRGEYPSEEDLDLLSRLGTAVRTEDLSEARGREAAAEELIEYLKRQEGIK